MDGASKSHTRTSLFNVRPAGRPVLPLCVIGPYFDIFSLAGHLGGSHCSPLLTYERAEHAFTQNDARNDSSDHVTRRAVVVGEQ